MSTHTLYLCYFGLREPLVQTQVLPYLRQLATDGLDVSLLTFEPQLHKAWTEHDRITEQRRLADGGISWYSLAYHKRPTIPATLYDILAGTWTAMSLVRQHRINVLHARAHVPMAMALLAQWLIGCCVIFDIRGLMADEYHDAGIWSHRSLPFKLVKLLERTGIRKADQIVVLTCRMREWLLEQKLANAPKIEVIPCCVDFSRFDTATARGAIPDTKRFELVYAGSVTGLYLLEEMGRFFLKLKERRSDAFLRILTSSSLSKAASVLERVGLSSDDFWVGYARPDEVPAYLHRAQLGISFRKPTFSQIAASPTKVPEYLAAGLPVICNYGIGDFDKLLEKEGVGVIVKSFNDRAYAEAVDHALVLATDTELRTRCVHTAHQYFDLLDVGRNGYRNLYQRISEQRAPTAKSEKSSPKF